MEVMFWGWISHVWGLSVAIGGLAPVALLSSPLSVLYLWESSSWYRRTILTEHLLRTCTVIT